MKSLYDTLQQVKQELMSYLDSKLDPIYAKLIGLERSLSTLVDHVLLFDQRVRVNEENLTDCHHSSQTT